MEAYEKRMIEEFNNLYYSIQRGELFISGESPAFLNLPDIDKELLSKQIGHMTEYRNCLAARIKRSKGYHEIEDAKLLGLLNDCTKDTIF